MLSLPCESGRVAPSVMRIAVKFAVFTLQIVVCYTCLGCVSVVLPAVFTLQIWVCYTLYCLTISKSKNAGIRECKILEHIAFGPPAEGEQPPYEVCHGCVAPSLFASFESQPVVGIPTLFCI